MRSAELPGAEGASRPRRRRTVGLAPSRRASAPSRSRSRPPRAPRRYSASGSACRSGSAWPHARRSFDTARCRLGRTVPRPRSSPVLPRGPPSIVTCNRVLLRTPQGRKQARQPWSAEFPLHVACEGVVVRDLLLDLQELVVEAAALFLQALQRIEEMLLPEAPALRLLPSHLEGTGHVSAPWESGRRGTARAASAPRPSGR